MMKFPAIQLAILVSMLISAFALSCSSSKLEEDAQVRIGQFLWTTDRATVEFYKANEKMDIQTLEYGKLTDYKSMSQGQYLVKVKANDQLILEKQVGLGPGGIYTLYLAGIPKQNQKVNKETSGNKLHKIVEGASARTANGYLPQLFLQNDFYIRVKEQGHLRFVHLMPGTAPLEIRLRKKNNRALRFKPLPFPGVTTTESLAAGSYELLLSLSGSPVTISQSNLQIENRILHTFFIIPNKRQYLTTPLVIGGTTEKRDQ